MSSSITEHVTSQITGVGAEPNPQPTSKRYISGGRPRGIAEPWLIVARVLQGVSGAVMFPPAFGMVLASFSKPRAGA